MKLSKSEQIKSLQEMIDYIQSKKKSDKLDKLLIENWNRSIQILQR